MKMPFAAVGVAVFLGAMVVVADFWAVAPNGSDSLKTLVPMPVVLVLLACVAASPVALACCFVARWRATAIRVLASSLILMGTLFVSGRVGNRVRMKAFHALAERSLPLVEAIRDYQECNGEPPSSLNDLVPEYLSSVPTTGMRAYPKYDYKVCQENRCDGNPWMLSVFTPSGVLNFDKFFYYPLQNYSSWCCDRIEPVSDLVYVHE